MSRDLIKHCQDELAQEHKQQDEFMTTLISLMKQNTQSCKSLKELRMSTVVRG